MPTRRALERHRSAPRRDALAGVPLLRTSTRRTFRQCRQRWWWGVVEGYEPSFHNFNALWFGTGVHLALAEWYKPGKKRGVHPVKTWKKYADDEFSWARTGEYGTPEEEMVKVGDLGEAMLTGYVDKYGKDPEWDVIAPERVGRVLIPHPDKPGEFIVQYVFTFDLVYRDLHDGIIKLGEHKTAAQVRLGHLSLDDQAGSYLPMATTILRDEGLLKPTDRIEVITYNILRKAIPNPDPRPRNAEGKFLNLDGTVSKRQNAQAPFFVREDVERGRDERITQVKRIQAEAREIQECLDDESRVYKNPTMDCSYCPFLQVCELHESGGDYETLLASTFKKRDPNEPYRKWA
jgi:hypothetical protein